MNSPFKLQIHFKNDCNWIYSFFVKFKNLKYVGIFDYMQDTVRIRTVYTRKLYFLKGI